MSVKVLVVDDSSFFRRRVAEIINKAQELEVVGLAKNGQEAIEQAIKIKPDVITMDIEMPVLDGISAVKKIMAESPRPILMFSSLTHDGAKATLEALDAGAADFLPKKFEDIARDRNEAISLLQQKIIALGTQGRRRFSRAPSPTEKAPAPSFKPRAEVSRPSAPAAPRRAKGNQNYKMLAIGTSTGGPVALQTILTKLPKNFPCPIVMVQHMPAAFTPAFANRLNSMCQIEVKEAEDGDSLKNGVAYLAPGGKQMVVEGSGSNPRIRVFEETSVRVTYKPSVDVSFASVAKSVGGDVLGVILTGMGADGREGCRMLKERGATIWAQDENSCVVYGMPQAVASAGISERSLGLNEFAGEIISEVMAGAH